MRQVLVCNSSKPMNTSENTIQNAPREVNTQFVPARIRLLDATCPDLYNLPVPLPPSEEGG